MCLSVSCLIAAEAPLGFICNMKPLRLYAVGLPGSCRSCSHKLAYAVHEIFRHRDGWRQFASVLPSAISRFACCVDGVLRLIRDAHCRDCSFGYASVILMVRYVDYHKNII